MQNFNSLNTFEQNDTVVSSFITHDDALIDINEHLLRNEIIDSLKDQGFNIKSLFNKDSLNLNKEVYKKLQRPSAIEQQKLHKKILINFLSTVKPHMKNLNEIKPDKIKLKLIEVTPNSFYEKIFKWWNFAWWSMPYQRAYGRQMRFIIWDTFHNAPFGLIGLQSPILKMSARDTYLKIPNEELDLWINQSMNAQRIGALPPYNDLIGGKMVSLSLLSKEIRLAYKRKYEDATTLIENRKIKPELLFLTTTSAFGRSSIYNRLKYENHLIAQSLGYTKGFGSFHINETLFQKILKFLESKGINTHRSFGSGPSRRIKLLNQAFRLLDIPGIEQHGLKRELFIFENVSNIHEVIENGSKPKYYNYSLKELTEFWKNRWCKNRSIKLNNINNFNKDLFINDLLKTLS